MNKLAIIGAGGHARSVIDLFQQMNEYEIIGCLDPCYKVQKTVSHMQNMPIIGDDSLLESLSQKGIEYAFVALGDNKKREKMMRMAKRYSLKLATAISPGAYISPNANIGEGSCIMAGAVLNVNCAIGKGVIINTNASIDHDCKIGNYVHIAPGTAISGYTTISNGHPLNKSTVQNLVVLLKQVIKFAIRKKFIKNFTIEIHFAIQTPVKNQKVFNKTEQTQMIQALLANLNYKNFGILLCLK